MTILLSGSLRLKQYLKSLTHRSSDRDAETDASKVTTHTQRETDTEGQTEANVIKGHVPQRKSVQRQQPSWLIGAWKASNNNYYDICLLRRRNCNVHWQQKSADGQKRA